MDGQVIVVVTALLLSALLSLGHNQDLDGCNNCVGTLGEIVPPCHCDVLCEFYGDCCTDRQPEQNDATKYRAKFRCRSVFVEGSVPRGNGVEKAFWMVESCLPGWNGTQTERDCKNSSKFYPVSDTNTGAVYSNEHCATCNFVSGTLLYWQYNLVCSKALLSNLTSQIQNGALIKLTVELLRDSCHPCKYIVPKSIFLTSGPTLGHPAPPTRSCYLNTASCLSKEKLEAYTLQHWTDNEYSELVEKCTSGPRNLVAEIFLQSNVYRNQYCAICNGLNTDFLECANSVSPLNSCTYAGDTPPSQADPPPPTDGSGEMTETSPTFYYRNEYENGIGGGSLSVVLDVFRDGLVVVRSDTTTLLAVVCSAGQVFDPVLEDCRETVSPEIFRLGGPLVDAPLPPINVSTDMTNDTYCPEGTVALNTSEFQWLDNNTLLLNGTVYDIIIMDPMGRPVVCLSIPLCLSYIALTEEDDYEYTDNDTIRYNDEEYHVMSRDTLGQPVICANFSINGTREVNLTVFTYSYPGAFVALSYTGCSFSVLGCALILLTYGLFKELRTLPSKILMNLAAAILVSNLFLLLSDLGGDSQDFCIATAIILHLFFLAQFSWMSIMTFEMGRTFNQARKLCPISENMNNPQMLVMYTVLGWGIPAIIVGASVAVNFTIDDLVLYGETEDGEEGRCWINHLESAAVVLAAPIALSIIFNAVVFFFVSVWLFWAWRMQTTFNKEQGVPFLRVYLAIVSVTGLTWIFGFLAILAGTSWSWYPFIILNSFQGFTIFVLFLLTRKVLNRYLACLTCGRVKEVPAPLVSTRQVLTNLASKGSTQAHSSRSSPDPELTLSTNTLSHDVEQDIRTATEAAL